MAVYKLLIENDFEDLDCKLFAIHTNLEEYRLAYFLNQILKINLKIAEDYKQIEQKQTSHFFSNYIFEEIQTGVFWTLIQNENETEKALLSNNDLFSSTQESFSTKVYFLPELKKVNYILKVESSHEIYESEEIIEKINSIKRIATVYEVDIQTLKSKNNLIY